jgi:hypothetical protein
MSLFARAAAQLPLSPAERAVLRFVKALLVTAILATLPVFTALITALQSGNLVVDWNAWGMRLLTAAGAAVALAIQKYYTAQGDTVPLAAPKAAPAASPVAIPAPPASDAPAAPSYTAVGPGTVTAPDWKNVQVTYYPNAHASPSTIPTSVAAAMAAASPPVAPQAPPVVASDAPAPVAPAVVATPPASAQATTDTSAT